MVERGGAGLRKARPWGLSTSSIKKEVKTFQLDLCQGFSLCPDLSLYCLVGRGPGNWRSKSPGGSHGCGLRLGAYTGPPLLLQHSYCGGGHLVALPWAWRGLEDRPCPPSPVTACLRWLLIWETARARIQDGSRGGSGRARPRPSIIRGGWGGVGAGQERRRRVRARGGRNMEPLLQRGQREGEEPGVSECVSQTVSCGQFVWPLLRRFQIAGRE